MPASPVVRPEKRRYLPSVNVDLDRQRGEVASGYVITPNALRATARICEAIGAGAGGAWTLTGPFGTGKSAYCVFLSHLVAPSGKALSTECVERLRRVDPRMARSVSPGPQARAGLHLVTVTGSAEPIQQALGRALGADGLVESLGLSRAAARTVRQVATRSKDPRAIRTGEILKAVDALIDDVPGRRHAGGMLLVIDELGKLLEHARANPEASDVYLLQQLAERALRSHGRLYLVAVLHQDFRAYASGLGATDRAEWEKIRGRFEDLVFDEPPGQLLRFVSLAWQRLREAEQLAVAPATAKRVSRLASKLWDVGMGPHGLDKQEGIALLAGASPLHPLVSSLLGPLFRRVGQNERSAFGFLAADDPLAPKATMRSGGPSHLYDVVDLYGYLRSRIGNGLLHTPDSKRWSEVFEAESRHVTLSATATQVFQAVALLSIASRWGPVQACRSGLAYALEQRLTSSQLNDALAELARASVLVHRKYNDSYSIWEGSDVDVEARLEEGRGRAARTEVISEHLNRHHRIRPLLARRHGYETGTLRVFGLVFAHADELGRLEQAPPGHDGRIVIVLPAKAGDGTASAELFTSFDDRTILRVLPKDDRLYAFARELGAIEWVRGNTPEVANDGAARRELQSRAMEITRSLDEMIERALYSDAKDGSRWVHKGKGVRITSGRQLNELLSGICATVFSAAPRIDNEIINRNELSSAAAAARGTLVKHMIEHSAEPELGLKGDPPERSIYRSVLGLEGRLGLHRSVSGAWGFRQPDRKSPAYRVFAEIESFFETGHGNGETVRSLFTRLRNPPYGLREGVLPIFVCAALLAHESDVAVYEDGAFCRDFSSAVYDRVMKGPERFTIRNWNITGLHNTVFEELQRLLGLQSPPSSDKHRIMVVVRPFMRFVRSLPQYAKQTTTLSPSAVAVVRAIEDATDPGTLLFVTLPQACGLEPFRETDKGRGNDIQRYQRAIKTAFGELEAAYPALLVIVRKCIADAFGVAADLSELPGRLSDRATKLTCFAVEPDLRILLDRMLARDITETQWAEGVASFVSERPVEKWRDEDRERFAVRLGQFARRFALLEATVADRTSGDGLRASIRVALTGTEFGQLDRAIHLDDPGAKEAAKLWKHLEDVLVECSNPGVAVAALCEALRSRLQPGEVTQ